MQRDFLCKIYDKIKSIKWTQTGKISIISTRFAIGQKTYGFKKGHGQKGRYI